MENKHTEKLFLSILFLVSGINFSTWASRIPSIKESFGLNEAELGSLLLSLPVGSLIGLPISGWLVSKFDSRIPMVASFTLMAFSLMAIGYADNLIWLSVFMVLFSFNLRITAVTINTQAVVIQKKFDKNINGMFHGLWSVGGIIGIGFSTLMIAKDISLSLHFTLVTSMVIIISLIAYRYLLSGDKSDSGNKLVIGKPNPYILYLGLTIMFAAICEGGMFDWSGLFFKDVVGTEIFTLGYLIFMTFMAISRFTYNKIINTFGVPKTYVFSALFIFIGIMLAVIFPYFWTAMFGFCMVGFGTAAVVPMTMSLGSKSKKYSPGLAIAIISTYAMFGMLIGPPLIGFLAHALSLQVAFVTFAIAGLMLIVTTRGFFNLKDAPQKL